MSELETSYVLLKNKHGLRIKLSTLGAGVRELTLDDKPLILQPVSEQTYLSSPQFFGKTISRFIGRLPSHVSINGKQYDLEEETPGICLHGVYRKSMIFENYDVTLSEDDENLICDFFRLSKDGNCGFPGNLQLHVIYLLSKRENRFTIEYHAISDQDTLLSVSNHMYWHLPETKSVDECSLFIDAKECGKFYSNSLLIEGKERVSRCLDFSNKPLLKQKLDEIKEEIPSVGNLDHTFVFEGVKTTIPRVIFSSKTYEISCFTDFEAANIYVDSTLTPVDFSYDDGLKTRIRRGLAIEPQDFVGFHRFLKANDIYSHFISYSIKMK